MPSKRSAFSGLVIELAGGLARGPILPYGSLGSMVRGAGAASSFGNSPRPPPRPPNPPCGAPSVVIVKLPSVGRIGLGALKATGGRIVVDWIASPDGASMRRIHCDPSLPPARFDVKKR